MRKRTALLVALVTLVLAATALPAAAGAESLTLHKESAEGPVLELGTPVILFGTDFTLESELGKIECAESELKGETVSAPSETASTEFSEARFQGAGGSGLCKNSLEFLGITTAVTRLNLPWAINWKKDATSTITGTPTVKFQVTYYMNKVQSMVCYYESKTVADTFTLNKPIGDKVALVTLALGAGSSKGCTATQKFKLTVDMKAGGIIVVPAKN